MSTGINKARKKEGKGVGRNEGREERRKGLSLEGWNDGGIERNKRQKEGEEERNESEK